VLLVHGDDDRNVPFQQTTDLVENFAPKKSRFEELIFPDEIHDLLRWSDWIRAYGATAEFFETQVACLGRAAISCCEREEGIRTSLCDHRRPRPLNPSSNC